MKLLAAQRNRLLTKKRKIEQHLTFLEEKQKTYKEMLADRDR